jgi:ABC-2 type transport system permease protein
MTRTRPPSVPWLLVRLKLRLTFNRIRTARAGTLNAVVSSVLALAAGVAAFFLVAASASVDDPRVSQGVLVLGSSALLLGWVIFPMITFGTDETLDPARLQLLPLRRRPLMAGLVASSFVGFAPVAAVIAVAGAVIGYGVGPWIVITALAGLLLLLLCAASARMVTTLLASRLTSRRGRDTMVFVASFLALAVQGLRFVRFNSVDPELVDRLISVCRWFPPGMLGHAIFDAHDGAYGIAVVEVMATAVLLPAVVLVWASALDRSLTVVTGGMTVPRRERSPRRSGLALMIERLPFITPTPAGAVAARELRYVARDPKRKVLVINSILLGLGGPLYLSFRAGGGLSPDSVLLSSVAGVIALLGSMNQFGFDGAALWLDVVAGNHVREELIGKNLALAVQVVPVIAAAGIVLALVSGGWLYLPGALAMGLGGLGAGLAVANVVSVRYPQRLPENRNPFAGGGAGQGCGTAMIVMVCLLIQWLVLVPVGIAGLIIAVGGAAFTIPLAPAIALYGFVVWRAGLGMATRWAFWRQPELLLAVDPRRG